jgi:hypothetical protein
VATVQCMEDYCTTPRL